MGYTALEKSAITVEEMAEFVDKFDKDHQHLYHRYPDIQTLTVIAGMALAQFLHLLDRGGVFYQLVNAAAPDLATRLANARNTVAGGTVAGVQGTLKREEVPMSQPENETIPEGETASPDGPVADGQQ